MKRLANMVLLPMRISVVLTLALLTVGVAYCETSFSVQVGTAYTANPPLLWNKLGSFSEVEHSEIGQNLEAYGDLVFNPCKFGNGITPREGGAQAYASIQDSGIFKPEAGAVELWMYLYDYPVGWDYGVYGFVNVIHDDANSNPLILSYYNDYWGTGNIGMYLKFGASQAVPLYLFNLEYLPPLLTPVHLAFVWNRKGIDGTADTMRIYVDGVLKKTSSESNWGTNVYTGETTVASKVAPAWDWNYTNDRYIMDNIKVWDYSKVDYSDRENEGITTSANYTATRSFTIQDGGQAQLGSLQSFLGISPSVFSGINGGVNTTITWSNPSVNNIVFMLSNATTSIVSVWTGALSISRDDMTNYSVYAVIEPIQITGVESGKQYIPGRVINISFANGYNSQSILLDGAAYTSGSPINSVGTHTVVATCISPIGVLNTKTVTFDIIPAQMPAAPYGVSSQLSLTNVRLSWNADQKPLDVAYPVTGYRIYRGENNGSPSQIGTSGTEKTFIDNGADQAKSYNYYISTIDSMGNESELSAVINVNTVADLVYTYDPVIKTRDTTVNARFVDNVGNTIVLDNTTIILQCIVGNGLVDGSAGAINKNLVATGSFSLVLTAGANVGDNVVRVKSGNYEKTITVYAGEVALVAAFSDSTIMQNESQTGNIDIVVEASYGGKTWSDIPVQYAASSGTFTVAGPTTGADGKSYAMYIPNTLVGGYVADNITISSPGTSSKTVEGVRTIFEPVSVPDVIGSPVADAYISDIPSSMMNGYLSGRREASINDYNPFGIDEIIYGCRCTGDTIGISSFFEGGRSASTAYDSIGVAGLGDLIYYGMGADLQDLIDREISSSGFESGSGYFAGSWGSSGDNSEGGYSSEYNSFSDDWNNEYIDNGFSEYHGGDGTENTDIGDSGSSDVSGFCNPDSDEEDPDVLLAEWTQENEENEMDPDTGFENPGDGTDSDTNNETDGDTDSDMSGFDSDMNGFDSDMSGFDSDMSGFDSGMGGFDSGMGGFDSGMGGFDSGMGGFDSGMGGFDSGMSGFDSSMSGYDSGYYGGGYDYYSQGSTENPVNTYTGNMLHKVNDIVVKTLGFPIYVTRSYNSLNPKLSLFGFGWSFNYIERLIFKTNMSTVYAYFVRSDGAKIRFTLDATGTNFISMTGNVDHLYVDANGQYRLDLKLKITYYFDERGNRTRIVKKGLSTYFAYNADNQLIKVYDENNRGLVFTYNTDNKCIASVTDPIGQVYNYSYDANTNLIDVSAPNYHAFYSYGANHTLIFRNDPKAKMRLKYRRYEFDAFNRCIKEIDAVGNAFTISYDNPELYNGENCAVTIQTDELGKQSKHIYNKQGYLIAKVDTAGNVERFTYGNGVSVTEHVDRNGATNRYEYNSSYYRTKWIDALSNVTTYVYDTSCSCGAMIAVTNALGEATQYEYDNNHNITRVIYPDGRQKRTTYNLYSLPIRVTDRNGNSITYDYDTAGNLILVTYPIPAYLTQVPTSAFTYDALGRRTGTKDKNGNWITYSYNGLNNITNTTYPGGATKQMEYDSLGRLVKKIDEAGNVKESVYNLQGQRLAVIDELGNRTTFQYLPNNMLLSRTDANGNTTSFGYDNAYRRIAITNALGGVRLMAYDKNGKLVAKTNERGYSTTYYRDARGNITNIIDALGNRRAFMYDALNRIISQVDVDGFASTRLYNATGRVVSVTDKLGQTKYHEYDGNGNITKTTDRNGNSVTYTYDPLNRRISKIDALGNIRAYEYDGNGNRVKVIDALGNVKRYYYNTRNKLTTIVDALGYSETFEYDARMLRISKTDKNGAVTTYRHDTKKRVIEVVDATGKSAFRSYDSVGNLTNRTDRMGYATTFVYNELNKRVKVIDALNNERTIGYDASGNIVRHTDARGNVTQFEYNALNRKIKTIFANGASRQREYDARGYVTAQIDELGNTTRFSYDVLGRRTNITDALSHVISQEYNSNGTIIARTDKNGNKTIFVRDANNRVISITNALGGVKRYEYNANGKRVKVIDARGYETRYVYDARNMRTSTIDPLGYTKQYSYNGNGKITGITDKNNALTQFRYNALGKIVEIVDANNKSLKYEYDANGNRVKTVDKMGHETTYVYNELNRLIRLVNAIGASISYEHNENGYVAKRTDAKGNVTSYEYDVMNRQTKSTSPDGTTHQREYDLRGHITARIDQAGNRTRYLFDALGRETNRIDALGNSSSREYDNNGKIKTRIDKNGNVTRLGHDTLNRLIAITNALGGITRYEYDARGNRTAVIDALGNVTRFEYNGRNELTKAMDAKNAAMSYEYDGRGRITKITDKNGAPSTFVYDALGRLTEIVDAFGKSIRTEYNANDQRTRVIDKRGYVTRFSYDAMDRLIESIDALNNSTRLGYDANGKVTNVIDANGRQTRFEYDVMDRQTNTISPNGTTRRTEYDIRGLVTARIDEIGRVTRFEYNALRRLVKTIDAMMNATTYVYDKNGNRIAFTNALGNAWLYDFDALNRFTALTDPLGNSSSNLFNAVNKVVETKKPNGERLAYRYDELLRLTNETHYRNDASMFKTIHYAHDAMGRTTAVMDGFAQMNYAYDMLGRVTNEGVAINGTAKSMRHMYDENGNRITNIDYENRTNVYGYDELNRITNLSAQSLAGNVLSTEYGYDALGNRKRMKLPNSIETKYEFDDVQRLTYIAFNRTEGSSIDEIGYEYNSVGNRTSKRNRNGSEQYLYDSINQITNAVYANSEYEEFEYDGVGNRKKYRTATSSTASSFDAANRLLKEIKAIDGTTKTVDYEYNANGDMTKKTEDVTQATAYKRQPDGHIENIEYPTGDSKPSSEYKYSGILTRMVKIDSSGTNIYLYDGYNATYVYDENFRIRKHFIHGPGVDAPIAAEVTATNKIVKRYYHLSDGLGSVTYLVNDVQEIVQTYKYKVFGEPAIEGQDVTVYTYTGREYDNDSGLYYYRSRYYDARMGRFSRTDDLLSGLNWYIYAKNNPLSYIDPLGFDETERNIIIVTTGSDPGFTMIGIGGGGRGAPSAPGTRFNPDQEALVDLAKSSKGGLTAEQSKIMQQWGREYNIVPNRIDPAHSGSVNFPHMHLGPVNHIRICPPISQP